MPDPTTPRQVGEALRQALAYDNPRFLSLRVSKHALSELLREFDALAKDHEAALSALNEYAQERKPLTEHQRTSLFLSLNESNVQADTPSAMFTVIVQAVERAHGINADAAQQPAKVEAQQEPEFWYDRTNLELLPHALYLELSAKHPGRFEGFKPFYAATQPAHPPAQPRLTVRVTSFPETNGRRNWTAMLMRVEPWRGLIGNCGGITLARGELWNRVAYEAECARTLLGERDTEPHILDYGDDIQTPEDWAGEVRGGRAIPATRPQPQAPDCLKDWRLNHAQADEDGVWWVGHLDDEDDRFSPVIQVDTANYDFPEHSEPIARYLLAMLAARPEKAPQVQPLPPVMGVSRDAECPKSLAVFFRREPTDDEMRALHELVWAHGTTGG